jgi:hypothetical protein
MKAMAALAPQLKALQAKYAAAAAIVASDLAIASVRRRDSDARERRRWSGDLRCRGDHWRQHAELGYRAVGAAERRHGSWRPCGPPRRWASAKSRQKSRAKARSANVDRYLRRVCHVATTITAIPGAAIRAAPPEGILSTGYTGDNTCRPRIGGPLRGRMRGLAMDHTQTGSTA